MNYNSKFYFVYVQIVQNIWSKKFSASFYDVPEKFELK